MQAGRHDDDFVPTGRLVASGGRRSGCFCRALAMAMAAAAPRYWVSRDVPASLHAAMRALGWDNEAAAAGELEDADLSRCALVWKTARLSASEWAHVRRAAGRQCRVNHFEGMRITEKAELCRALRRMAAVHGAATFDFHPQTFQLPAEAALFAREAALHEAEGALWIIKPASSSRGRGIHLVRRAEEARVGFGGCVAQRYVARPLLVGGFKFDMRVYVLVASLVPLTVYICQEGLARFGTARYDAGDTGNLFAHLTNFTLNKRSPGLAVDKEVIGAGAKWTLSRLLAHLAADRGVDTTALWRRVELIAALTVLSCVQSARADSRSFQLLGLGERGQAQRSPRPSLVSLRGARRYPGGRGRAAVAARGQPIAVHRRLFRGGPRGEAGERAPHLAAPCALSHALRTARSPCSVGCSHCSASRRHTPPPQTQSSRRSSLQSPRPPRCARAKAAGNCSTPTHAGRRVGNEAPSPRRKRARRLCVAPSRS
jgi:hypothetical protein